MNWLKSGLTMALLCLLGGIQAKAQIQIHHTGNVKGSLPHAALPVSIVINPTYGFVAIGKTAQLSATGTYADATTADVTNQVTWSSSNPNLATVSSSGLASGNAAGRVTITASFAGGPSKAATLTIGANGYIYQSEPYAWTDISTTGASIFTIPTYGLDDDCKAVTPGGATPLNFVFYGNSYSTFYVSTNGAIIFGGSSTAFSNYAIPNVRAPNNFIAVQFADLHLTKNKGQVYWKLQGTAPTRSLIIQWNDIDHLYYQTGYITFQAELYEGTNQIVMRYKDVVFGGISSDGGLLDYGQGATVGLENSTGSAGCMYSYNQKALSDGQAIRFIYQTQ